METRDMVRMANQIGSFFKSYGEKEALEGIAEHLNKFWEPRMRNMLFAHLDQGGEGISDLVKRASANVKRPKAA
jgi:formate dehydrogenase subunit delta